MSIHLVLSIFVFAAGMAVGMDARAAKADVRPASAELGVVVDSASASHAREGLRVLGATPGSVADQLGLRPGDLLVDVNGISLRDLGADANGRALASATFNTRIASLPQSVPLRLLVVRDGVNMAMNAPLHAQAVASTDVTEGDTLAASTAHGCGRISTLDGAPRSKHQYHASVLLLDGAAPDPTGQQNYLVKSGVHELLIAEDIPALETGLGQTARARRHTRKKLAVTVLPNTTYMVAAQLHVDKVDELSTGGYWDPLVWREIPEACH
ncbi:MAG: PDZ domain-containing protein [Rudaea sp.]